MINTFYLEYKQQTNNNKMWDIKYFKTYEGARKFMLRNNYKNRYRYELIFVEDGYAVEYKKLKQIIL